MSFVWRRGRRLGWLVLGCLAAAIALAPAPRLGAAPTDRHVRIEARSFAFSPATLTVNQGDRVVIDLVAADVVHGLHVDGYDVHVTADPGRTARLAFVADRPGSFRFRCSVTCGALHPFMIGKLRVGPDWWFWRAVGLAVVATAAGALVVGGRQPHAA